MGEAREGPKDYPRRAPGSLTRPSPHYGRNIATAREAIIAIGLKSVAVHITVPRELLKEVDEQAKQEQRTRSEILREAICHYLEEQRKKALEEQRLRWLLRALEESAGGWRAEAHPELKGREDARRLREELWQGDQERLFHRVERP